MGRGSGESPGVDGGPLALEGGWRGRSGLKTPAVFGPLSGRRGQELSRSSGPPSGSSPVALLGAVWPQGRAGTHQPSEPRETYDPDARLRRGCRLWGRRPSPWGPGAQTPQPARQLPLGSRSPWFPPAGWGGGAWSILATPGCPVQRLTAWAWAAFPRTVENHGLTLAQSRHRGYCWERASEEWRPSLWPRLVPTMVGLWPGLQPQGRVTQTLSEALWPGGSRGR